MTKEASDSKQRSFSLGALEGDILRILWDAGESQTSVHIYGALHFSRRAEKRDMPSPSTIAVTLSRMVEKGLLSIQPRPNAGKGYYKPKLSRAEVAVSMLEDASRILTGQSLSYLIKAATSGQEDPIAAHISETVKALKEKMKSDSKALPPRKIDY